MFDDGHTGHLDTDKVVDTLANFNYGTQEERLRFIFDIYDINGTFLYKIIFKW